MSPPPPLCGLVCHAVVQDIVDGDDLGRGDFELGVEIKRGATEDRLQRDALAIGVPKLGDLLPAETRGRGQGRGLWLQRGEGSRGQALKAGLVHALVLLPYCAKMLAFLSRSAMHLKCDPMRSPCMRAHLLKHTGLGCKIGLRAGRGCRMAASRQLP